MAIVLRVSFEDDPPSSIGKKDDVVILKLYDRRFAEDLRRNHRAAPYTSALEANYLQNPIDRPPGSSGLPDPAENFLTGRLRGDVGDNWMPSTQKPDCWERDEACPYYPGTKYGCGSTGASGAGDEPVQDSAAEESGDQGDEEDQEIELDEDQPEEGEIDDEEDAEEGEEEEEGEEPEESMEEDEEEKEEEHDDVESEYGEEIYGTSVQNLRPLQWRCLYLASCEETVYGRLRPLQLAGRVPTFLSSVELVVNSLSSIQLPDNMAEGSKAQVRQFLSISGILISLIDEDAFPALELGNFAPGEEWQQGLQAVADVVNALGDLAVYNEDARPENIMLKRIITAAGTEYKATAFDFAQARVRRDDESDQEWQEHKYKLDEEGAVLAVMRGSRGLKLGQNYSWRTEGLGGTARHFVLEDDMVYYWGGGCTGSAYA